METKQCFKYMNIFISLAYFRNYFKEVKKYTMQYILGSKELLRQWKHQGEEY